MPFLDDVTVQDRDVVANTREDALKDDALVPTNLPALGNQAGYIDEFGAETWPANLWSQTGVATAPVKVSGLTAYAWTLGSGERVELRPLLSSTRIDGPNSTTRLLYRYSSASTHQLLFGLVDGGGDAIGANPADGVWVRRNASGDCSLNVGRAGVVETAALVFGLVPDGWCDMAIEVVMGARRMKATVFAAGIPVAALYDLEPPQAWLWPRLGAKGAGVFALDRVGRATVGPTICESQ